MTRKWKMIRKKKYQSREHKKGRTKRERKEGRKDGYQDKQKMLNGGNKSEIKSIQIHYNALEKRQRFSERIQDS